MAYDTAATGAGDSSTSNNSFGYDPNQWSQANNLYSSLLGRSGSPDEVATHFVNGRLDPNAYQNIYNSPEATAFRNKPAATPPPTTTTGSGNQIKMPQGIDPRLAALYQKYNITPGDAGSGFTDWQYWQNKINSGDADYFLNRLGSDLAGNGPDAPAGAPQGSGNSGSGIDYAGLQNFISGMAGNSALNNVNIPDPTSRFTSNYDMTPQESDLYNQLVQRSNQSLNIDPQTDSVIRPQVDAFAAQQDKEARHALDSIAESSGPYASGTLLGQRRMLAENAAQSTNALQGQLVQNELGARRQEIQNALSQRGNMLSQQDQLSLQRQLQLINDQLQKASAQNQYMLGLGSLGLGQQQINSNNDQFAANYNLNATDRANYWDALRNGTL